MYLQVIRLCLVVSLLLNFKNYSHVYLDLVHLIFDEWKGTERRIGV